MDRRGYPTRNCTGCSTAIIFLTKIKRLGEVILGYLLYYTIYYSTSLQIHQIQLLNRVLESARRALSNEPKLSQIGQGIRKRRSFYPLELRALEQIWFSNRPCRILEKCENSEKQHSVFHFPRFGWVN